MFAGGILGWFVLIPAIVTFGGSTILYPGTISIADLYATREQVQSGVITSNISVLVPSQQVVL